MINKQELVQKVQERELPFELWETRNEQIYTRLCNDTDSLRGKYFQELDNEYLIMDCLLPNQNYFFGIANHKIVF